MYESILIAYACIVLVSGVLGCYSLQPILCESMIVLVEFTKTAMFSWMLIQGLHLQITLASVFNVTPNYKLYYGLGWGKSASPYP